MSAQAATILVIEDEPIIRDTMGDFLEDRNYRVVLAKNGQDGLEKFKQEQPDVVLTDLRMPEMGGLEVLQQVKEISPGTPLIVISGTGSINDSIQALRFGAWDYILKPIEDMTIVALSINKALEQVQLKKENLVYQNNLELLVQKRTMELEKANANLIQTNERLKRVVYSTSHLTAYSDINKFGPSIIDEYIEHMRASGGCLYLIKDEGLHLLNVKNHQNTSEFIAFPLEAESVIDQCIREKKPQIINDISVLENIERVTGSHTEGSIIIFPISDEASHVIGLIIIYSPKKGAFIKQDKEIGTILASFSYESIKAIQFAQTLKESEVEYRSTVNNLLIGVVVHSKDSKILLCNPEASHILGLSIEEIIGKTAKDPVWHFVYEDESRMQPEDYPVSRVISTQKPIINYVIGIIRPDKKHITWVNVNATPIFSENRGSLEKVVINFQDITHRKRMEKTLQVNEERYRTLVANIPGVAFRCFNDQDWTIEFISKEIENLSGYPVSDFIRNKIRPFASIIHPDDIDKVRTIINESITQNKTFAVEYRIKCANKQWKWVYERGQAVMSDGPEPIFFDGVIMDVTEQKQYEQALLEKEQLLTKIAGNYPNSYICIIEKDLSISFTSGQELVNQNISAEQFNKQTMQKVLYDHQLNTAGHITNTFKGMECTFEVLTNKHSLLFRTVPLANETGKIDRILAVAENITERKKDQDELRKQVKMYQVLSEKHQAQNEKLINSLNTIQQINKDLKKAKEKAEESEKLKSAFLANISHEIRTPMNAIMGFAEILKLGDMKQEDIFNYSDIIFNNSVHLLNLISDIVDFSKIEANHVTIVKRDININQLLNDLRINTQQLLQNYSKTQIEVKLETQFNDKDANILTDDVKLRQVLLNLLNNAVKFSNKGTILFGYKLLNKKSLQFFVKDEGKGIPKVMQSKVFERFIQIKDNETFHLSGAGLGLAISRTLVQKLGGEIHLESQVGKGSEFSFTLPY